MAWEIRITGSLDGSRHLRQYDLQGARRIRAQLLGTLGGSFCLLVT